MRLSLLLRCQKVNVFGELFHTKIREQFLHKIYMFHLPASAVEIGQFSGVGGEPEGELPAPETLMFFAVLPVEALAAVLAVPQQRVAGGSQMDPDLMGPGTAAPGWPGCGTW